MAWFAALVSAILLAACSAPTPYQPAANGHGYVERQIEPGRFRISFSGNDATPRATVEDYVLYRAAELTLAESRDHFLVVARSTDADTRYVRSYDRPPGYYPSYRPWYPSMYPPGRPYSRPVWYDPWSPLDGGTVTTQTITRYEAHAEVVLRSGPPPRGDANAYDAREVIARLGPTVVRAERRSP